MQISDDTGLPELPHGYYWNVQRYHRDDSVLHVTLCRSRRRPFPDQAIDTAVASIYTRTGNPTAPEESVARAAARAYDRSKYTIGAEMDEIQDRMDSLVGQYPPKRMP